MTAQHSRDPDDVTERHARVENLMLRYPRFKQLLDQIESCRASFSFAAEPRCMLIVGRTGAGKSTLVDCYVREHPAEHHRGDGATIPVLSATIPAPATMKSMATSLLDAMGDPLYDRGTLDQKTRRLYKLLRNCRVELLLLDEFQHFIDQDSDRVLHAVSDWLKNLISETNIPVILIGLPSCRSVLDANEQLRRRFSAQVELAPFRFGNEAERIDFATFLDKIEKGLGFPEPSGFADIAARFFAASDGVVALNMKIIRAAARCAIDLGLPQVDRELLADAFEQWVGYDKTRPNPFRDGWGGLILPPPPDNRPKPKLKDGAALSSILTA